MGDHIKAPAQHPIKGAGSGIQRLAVFCPNDLFHQGINGGVGQCHPIAALRRFGGGAGPVVPLFVTGVIGLREVADHYVVVIIPYAVKVLVDIDNA